MKYTDRFAGILKQMQDESSGQVESSNGPFWEMIIDSIIEIIRAEKDLDAFLKEEQILINFGITPELCPDPQSMVQSITGYPAEKMPIQIRTLTDMISNLVCKILKGDKEELLNKKITLSQIGMRKAEQEIISLQQQRKSLLQSLLEKVPSAQQHLKFLNVLDEIDTMHLESLRFKRTISNGAFLTVEQKRVHVDREKRLQKENQWYNSLLSLIKDRDCITDIKKATDQIAQLCNTQLDYEFSIEKANEELEKIKKQHQEISPLEIINKVQKELERIRDLVRLAARRLHCDSVPLLNSSSKFFTFEQISECFGRILEFDPKIFQNDRVTIFGTPHVLLVPGSGNALYDWENNCLIVPLTVPGGNSMASIANGVIEYRLDVDESRILLTSYNQLPDNKGIRSSTVLKTQLIKDYITWMTSEYKGFRVLKKDAKQWFEHEIAPVKNEIYTPPSYQIFSLSKEEYHEMLADAEEKLKNGLESCSDQDLWVSSILYYQKGEMQKALEMLQMIVSRKKPFPMVFYNIGQIASKLNLRQVAREGFTEYIKSNPQSWWAKNSQERLSKI